MWNALIVGADIGLKTLGKRKEETMSEIFGKECLNCQEWDCTWCRVYVEHKEKIERWEDEFHSKRD